MPPKVNKILAPPTMTCPDGCSMPVDGKCMCSPGGPAPCPPGTQDCSSFGGR